MIFAPRTDPSILTLIAPELLDQSNKISWVFWAMKITNHFLPSLTRSSRSESSSETKFTCCCKTDVWSNLQESCIIGIDCRYYKQQYYR